MQWNSWRSWVTWEHTRRKSPVGHQGLCSVASDGTNLADEKVWYRRVSEHGDEIRDLEDQNLNSNKWQSWNLATTELDLNTVLLLPADLKPAAIPYFMELWRKPDKFALAIISQ